MLEIIVDTREQAVIPFFNSYKNPPDITYKVQQVNIGDYNVVYNGHILFSIERKTWKDLASSMRDGRKDNVNKMIKLRDETKCQLIYLMEGIAIPNEKTKFCRVPYKALRSHLDHLAFRDGIHIMHSKNQKNTVERIYELIKNYLTIKPNPLLKYEKVGGDEKKLKEKIPVNPDAVIYKMWCCFSNITEKTASLFINKNYHISDLILGNISMDEIYALTYDNNYIIGSRATKIWNSSRIKELNNKYFIKMLTQINGITKSTAEIILNTVSLKDLLEGNIPIKTLIEIKKSANRKVGNKVASDVLIYLVK
jgi:ERCC4-type nuclease